MCQVDLFLFNHCSMPYIATHIAAILLQHGHRREVRTAVLLNVQAMDPSSASSSSSAQPAPSQPRPSALVSESVTLTLDEAERKVSEDSMREGTEALLQDIRILQRWKRTKNAPHKVRDAMLKLGSHWNVPQYVKKKKRPSSEVAEDVEEAILKKAREMFQSSVGKPARQRNGDEDDATEAATCICGFFKRKEGEPPASATDGMQQVSQPSLAQLLHQLQSRQAECPHQPNLSDLVKAISACLTWRRCSNTKSRDALRKQAVAWHIRTRGRQEHKQEEKQILQVANELENLLTVKATEALKGDAGQHAHWLHLCECTEWVKEQWRPMPRNLENEALSQVLSDIRSWLEMPRYTHHELRKNQHAKHRQALSQEIAVHSVPLELVTYAFTQHALRQLRAHISTWTDTIKAHAPTGLLGRAGQEHLQTLASDIAANPACWPFHLAGDSGQSLFNHRAWLSWRFLALIELPKLTVQELPCMSKDLQALIESTRTTAHTHGPVSQSIVEEILLSFFCDPADKLKGQWLRRALKLHKVCEDSIVEKHLQQAAAHAFTVLQSLLSSTDSHAAALLSPRFVACVAVYLYLQDSHSTKRISIWQPFHVQEYSTRVATSTTRLKSYISSDHLGNDENTLTLLERAQETPSDLIKG